MFKTSNMLYENLLKIHTTATLQSEQRVNTVLYSEMCLVYPKNYFCGSKRLEKQSTCDIIDVNYILVHCLQEAFIELNIKHNENIIELPHMNYFVYKTNEKFDAYLKNINDFDLDIKIIYSINT